MGGTTDCGRIPDFRAFGIRVRKSPYPDVCPDVLLFSQPLTECLRMSTANRFLVLASAFVAAACAGTHTAAVNLQRPDSVEAAWTRLQGYATRQDIAKLQVTAITYAVSRPPLRGEDLERTGSGSNLRCEIVLTTQEKNSLREAILGTRIVEQSDYGPDARWSVRFLSTEGRQVAKLYTGGGLSGLNKILTTDLDGHVAETTGAVLVWLDHRFLPPSGNDDIGARVQDSFLGASAAPRVTDPIPCR